MLLVSYVSCEMARHYVQTVGNTAKWIQPAHPFATAQFSVYVPGNV
jgi:hypothetical protein